MNQNKQENYSKSLKLLKWLFIVCGFIPAIFAGIIFSYIYTKVNPPAFNMQVPCINFTPDNFERDKEYSEEELEGYLVDIKKFSNCVRIYSVTRGLNKVPGIAERMGMEVIVGAWLTGDKFKINEEEIDNLVEVVKNHKNIKYIVVGNETVLLEFLLESQLIDYINEVKVRIYGTNNKDKIAKMYLTGEYPPITTAETYPVWIKHPRLVQAVDFIGIHSYSFWAFQPLERTNNFIDFELNEIESKYKKEVILLETGWPSNGPDLGLAKSGLLNQRQYFKMLDEYMKAENRFYGLGEMYDVPAKIKSTEGVLGVHWGILDKNGNQKLVLSLKDIFVWFGFYFLLLLIIGWYFYGFFKYPFIEQDSKHLRQNDSWLEFSFLFGFGVSLLVVIVVSTVALIYSKMMGGNLIILQILCFLLSVYATFEIIQKIMQFIISKHATKYLQSDFPRLQEGNIDKHKDALVSIHIAGKDEDPEQIIRTIESALRQDHSKVEVIYIDNNSKNKDSFHKVENHFKSLEISKVFGEGKALKLFHENNIFGFKAGALNYALRYTSPEAKFIAVLDSDYEAYPNWISLGLNYARDGVGFIQFPQAYIHDSNENMISRATRLEQNYVFKVMYPMRAILGNIVMNGTLVIINREAIGDLVWPTWSICEDGAFGAAIIAKGYRSSFVPIEVGLGKPPLNFVALCKQRNRWVFGSIQILKRWIGKKEYPLNRTLGLYFTDWLGWIMHGLYPVILFFTISFIFSVWYIYFSILFDWTFNLGLYFVSASLSLFLINIIKYILKRRRKLSFEYQILEIFKDIFALILLEISVVNTICRSVLQSIYKKNMNFNVTRSFVSNYRGLKEKFTLFITYILPTIFVLIAIFGFYIVTVKFIPPAIYVLYSQFIIVFLPQLIYLYYKLRY